MTAGQHDIFAGIAIHIAGLVPRGGDSLEEIQFGLRQLLQVIGLHGDALDGRLVGEGRGNLEGIGGLTRMTCLIVLRHILIHDDTTPVHRGHRITAERMHSEVEGLTHGSTLVEIHILAGQHSLRGHEVGIHALPATRQGAAMEDTLDAVAVGIEEDILVELHRLLLVATKEIDLDTLHADALEPGHLALTCHAGVQTVAWRLRRIVLEAVGVIPQHQRHAF